MLFGNFRVLGTLCFCSALASALVTACSTATLGSLCDACESSEVGGDSASGGAPFGGAGGSESDPPVKPEPPAEPPMYICGGATFDDDSDPGTECVPVTECTPGEFDAIKSTQTSDRACAPCAEGSFSSEPNAPSCLPWALCGPGTVEAEVPTATTNRACTGCPSGTFSTGGDACTPWSACPAGTFVVSGPSPSGDRLCEPCAAGVRTSGPNQSQCIAHDACAAGSIEVTPGTTTLDPVCAACTPGVHCPGGSAPSAPCGATDFDDDGDPATACVPFTPCAPGEVVLTQGTATTDQVCISCPEGEYASALNSGACAPLSTCEPGEYVAAPGTQVSDRVCDTCGEGQFSTIDNASSCQAWTKCSPARGTDLAGSATTDRTCKTWDFVVAFGTSHADRVFGVAASSDGSVYAVGYTSGQLTDASKAGQTDAFVQKRDSAGALLWTRQFGTSGFDQARAVALDGQGNVYVAGSTTGALAGPAAGGRDLFFRKYSSDGQVLWTTQMGSSANESPQGAVVSSDGIFTVTGVTAGALGGEVNTGGDDGFVVRLTETGVVDHTVLVGTPSADALTDVALDSIGGVFAVGETEGLLGAATTGGVDVVVIRIDAAGALEWAEQFGTVGADRAFGAATDVDGSLLITGETNGTLPGGANLGGWDAFAARFDAGGQPVWLRQFGTGLQDGATDIGRDAAGAIYVTGSTLGTLPDATTWGGQDGFIAGLTSTGVVSYSHQVGTTQADAALGLSVAPSGHPYLVGNTQGDVAPEVHRGLGDVFVARLAR